MLLCKKDPKHEKCNIYLNRKNEVFHLEKSIQLKIRWHKWMFNLIINFYELSHFTSETRLITLPASPSRRHNYVFRAKILYVNVLTVPKTEGAWWEINLNEISNLIYVLGSTLAALIFFLNGNNNLSALFPIYNNKIVGRARSLIKIKMSQFQQLFLLNNFLFNLTYRFQKW